MLTRCPGCGTTFRVTPEQLKVRSGRVRCGACRRVFDALTTLAEEAPPMAPSAAEESAPAALSLPPDEEPPPLRPTEPHAVEPAAGESEAGAPSTVEAEAALDEAAGVEEPQSAIAATEGQAVEDIETAPAGAAGTESADETSPEPSEALPAEPAAPALAEKPRRRRTWPWALGAGAAAVALVLQALLYLRTELAALYPETRPMLLEACNLLGCDLPHPRKPELVGIEASDISIADSRLSLSATLKNRAPFAQEYPHLELTLTDTADTPLVRRVLGPAEYLPARNETGAGFAARAEIAVNLYVALHDVKPAGYRLYLFYP